MVLENKVKFFKNQKVHIFLKYTNIVSQWAIELTLKKLWTTLKTFKKEC